MLRTARLNLRLWEDKHRDAFAALHADPAVMADLGELLDRRGSDAKLESYIAAYHKTGVSRWAVESHDGAFLGYAGVMPRTDAGHPLGAHHEVGWRLTRAAWGQGYATESARAALGHAFDLLGISEVVSYTSASNHRSQAVMGRLGLVRSPSRDFTAEYPGTGRWTGLVWTASRPQSGLSQQ